MDGKTLPFGVRALRGIRGRGSRHVGKTVRARRLADDAKRGFVVSTGSRGCGIQISCISLSASVHDSHQVAILVAIMSSEYMTNPHDLTDAACDTIGIGWTGYLSVQISIIDVNPSRDLQSMFCFLAKQFYHRLFRKRVQ